MSVCALQFNKKNSPSLCPYTACILSSEKFDQNIFSLVPSLVRRVPHLPGARKREMRNPGIKVGKCLEPENFTILQQLSVSLRISLDSFSRDHLQNQEQRKKLIYSIS